FLLTAMGVVFPAKADLLALERQEPMIRDRDPVRIASEITQDRQGSAEGSFGVDPPASQTQAAPMEGRSVTDRRDERGCCRRSDTRNHIPPLTVLFCALL